MNLQLNLTRLLKAIHVVSSACLLKPLIFHRVFAGAEHRKVLSSSLATVIDVGANRGQFALAARKWAPNARIVAFEPLPGPATIFRKVFRHDGAVILHQAAIGYASRQQTMHVSARDDSSSLLPISNLQVENFPGTAEVATLDVRVAPLGAFLDAEFIIAPAMLKLDVQGFELEALQGCESLLPRFSHVYCECSFVELYCGQALACDVIDWLSARGFKLAGMFNPAYDKRGRSLQADLLFQQDSN
jgi:FkbM family methyltransferase